MNCTECDARTYRTVAGRPLCADCDQRTNPLAVALEQQKLTERIEEESRR